MIETRAFAKLPEELRLSEHTSEWKPGQPGEIGARSSFLTEAETGWILRVEMPVPGKRLYSHA